MHFSKAAQNEVMEYRLTHALNMTPSKLKFFDNPKRWGLLGGVLFREMKFVLSNFLSNEDLSISYES